VALFAGKLIPFKRPVDLIHAAARARTGGLNLHVLIAGSGELQQELQTEAGNRNVPAHFMGFQNQSQMPAAYAASDMLVLPSNGRESWGLVANEAIASGCPLIVSDAVGCAPDLAADPNVGRTFPLADINALADAILYFSKTRPALGEILRYSARYGLDAAARGITAALDRAMMRRGLEAKSHA
jgi:glycosyltransferase involved in cell wall biosynthesis